MAFWGVEVKPGKPFTHSPDKACGRLRISQATLGIGSSNNKSLVQCNVGKKSPVLLCSLLPGILESCHLELEFEEAEGVTFSVIGARSVHLTGYYLSNVRHLAGIEESESFGEDIGETDTEKSGDHVDEDDYEDSFIDDGDPEVCPASPSSDEVGSRKKTKKKKGESLKCGRRLKKKYELSSSEDDHVLSEPDTASDGIRVQIVESDDDDQLPISSITRNDKTVTENLNRNDCVSGENKSEEGKCKGKKRKNNEEKGAPAISTTRENQSEERKVSKKKRKSGEENESLVVSNGSKDQSEEKQVKKKKRKSSNENEAPPQADSHRQFGNSEAELLTEPRGEKGELARKTLPGGLMFEEVENGNPDGKMATSGKKVTIHYSGKLKEGGQVFDSTVGKNPLKFRLGKGRALDGLDVGIEGMRVGDKRRLLIPPALGYGNEGSKLVPPNSWLIMDVELLRVH